MKILLADDDPHLVRALRITLSAHGYDIVTADDGATAIAAAASTHPDIVMLDLGMPRLDGLQVITALRCKRSKRWCGVIRPANMRPLQNKSSKSRATSSPARKW